MLEEEQEQLNSALMALTSHFAQVTIVVDILFLLDCSEVFGGDDFNLLFSQVQFRLKQIVDADADSKEKLLKELEEFAFRGIPDFQKSVRCVEGAQNASEVLVPDDEIVFVKVEQTSLRDFPQQDHSQKMESHRLKQQELIRELKQQLENLEQYAYETGEAGLPQTLVVERQKVIIGNAETTSINYKVTDNISQTDQMKNKLPLNIDELGKFSLDELRQQVDMAIGEVCAASELKLVDYEEKHKLMDFLK